MFPKWQFTFLVTTPKQVLHQFSVRILGALLNFHSSDTAHFRNNFSNIYLHLYFFSHTFKIAVGV